MDIINEKRGLIGFKQKSTAIHIFTYKDVDRHQVKPGYLGVKLNERSVYLEILHSQESKYLIEVILKSLRLSYDREIENIEDYLIDNLVALGFSVVDILNIRKRQNTLLYDFETSYPEYVKSVHPLRCSDLIIWVAKFLKRLSYQVNLDSVGKIQKSNFDHKFLTPDDFHSEQPCICVHQGSNKRLMLNFNQQLWLTNIPYSIEASAYYMDFFHAVKELGDQLQNRYMNYNVYHLVFSALCVHRVDDIDFRPAMITRLTTGQYLINHRPYLSRDRTLSKEDLPRLKNIVDKLSILSKEVNHDWTNS